MILDFLGSEKRDSLIEVLLSVKGRDGQTDLFGTCGREENLNKILDEIFYLAVNQRPLYNRWSRDVDGKRRNLSVPKKPLKQLAHGYILPLVKTKKAHERCHGGEDDWSPENSLVTHLPCSAALSFDLSNAFESFPPLSVYNFFTSLFSDSEYQEEISRFLTLISTVRHPSGRGLPIGSPLSMALFNRALYPLDQQLTRGSRERGFRYSRWVDDMTISSPDGREIESFFGAVELTHRQYSVSMDKIFFQDGRGDIYLLGQVISPDGRMRKNTKEERVWNKSSPLNYSVLSTGNYEPWI